MRALPTAVVVLLTTFTAGCASAPGTVVPAAAPESRTPAVDYTAGLRYGDECAATRARVLAAGNDSLPGLLEPQLKKMFMIPMPVPGAVRGATMLVTIPVDSVGVPVAAGLQVTGISHVQYIAKVKATIARIRFRPASLDGCAVAKSARISFLLLR